MMPPDALINFTFLFLLPELECRASFPITLNPLSGLSRHICSLQLQLRHLRHAHLSQHPWVRRPGAATGSSGARQETALQIWLSSFQQSPNSTACLNQGRGYPCRGTWQELGGRQLGQGHESDEPRKAHPATLLTRKPAACLTRSHLEAVSPLGTRCFVLALGAGGSVSESGVKSRVEASETGQGWTPESHQGLIQRLLLSFYNIFTRS